jgi:hypothetical protein
MTYERWATVSDFPDYEVSDLGRARRRTGGPGVRAGRVLKPSPNDGGYLAVTLYSNGKPRPHRLNRLVLTAFGRAPEPGEQASHLNGDKTDNRLENLCWETPKQNSARRVEHGTAPVGSRNPRSKLTEQQITDIREKYAAGGTSYPKLAREFGVSFALIGHIVNRKTWNHV